MQMVVQAKPERVQKILSRWGIASRRQAEKMILAGRVHLNGQVAHLGQKADLNIDILEVDGKAIQANACPPPIYLLLNKPAGVVSTCSDPQKRRTVLELLPAKLRSRQGIHPIGRLDLASTGALLLTNNGELTLNLTHPRYHLPKNYRVWVEGNPPESVLDNWRQGVMLSGKKTLPAQIRVLERRTNQTCLEVVITEGRNRQIRRVAEQLGFRVINLHRISIGPIQLHSPPQPPLKNGQYRFLTKSEIDFLNLLINPTSHTVPADTKENLL